jgi:hypothetical protein
MEYYRPNPPSPDKKESTLWKILLAGCSVLVIVGISFVLLFGKFCSFARAPTRTVRTHLEAINGSDYTKAYADFSAAYKDSYSYQDFCASVAAFSTQFPYRELNLHGVKIVNDRAYVDGTVTGRDGSIFPVHYELIRRKGDWKITSYEWASPGERLTV